MIVQCPLYVLGQQMDDFKHCSETWTFFSCYDVCTYDDTEPIIFFLIHLIQSTKLIMICTSTLWTQYHLTSRIVDNLYVFGTLIKTEKNQGWIDQFMNYTMLKTYLRN